MLKAALIADFNYYGNHTISFIALDPETTANIIALRADGKANEIDYLTPLYIAVLFISGTGGTVTMRGDVGEKRNLLISLTRALSKEEYSDLKSIAEDIFHMKVESRIDIGQN